jgi:cullin 3
LLLFNESETLTFGEIGIQTKIPVTELKKNILSLTQKSVSHEKLLLKDDKETTLSNDSKFVVNNDFTSKLIKVKIAGVVLKEAKQQLEETQKTLDEERKYSMDATIVRVMKSRKTMEHRDLVLECTKQLQSRFMPSPDGLKKRIESLIEREYLERSKDSRSKYNYLA